MLYMSSTIMAITCVEVSDAGVAGIWCAIAGKPALGGHST